MDCARLIHPDDRGEWFEALRQSFHSGRMDLSLRLLAPAGRVRFVSLRAEIDFDEEGQPQRLVGLLLDLTAQHAAVEALRRAEERFGTLMCPVVGVSCLHLPSAIAHELSQPIGKVLGLALAARTSLAEFPAASPELMRKIQGIVEGSLDASEVIRRIQARSRGEPIPFRALDLNQLVVDGLRKLQGASFLEGVEVSLDLTDDLPAVSGDPVELTQVLHNLIRNAAEAMAAKNPGAKTLLIRTRSDWSGEVAVAVIDRGPGLPPLPWAGSSKRHGLGLGLRICRSIALAHDGKISGANNDDGPGAIFTLTLPAAGLAQPPEPESNEIAFDRLCRR